MINEETIKVALAALLHDIGKFWQRAGRPGSHSEATAEFIEKFQEHLFPYEWLDDIRDGAGNHHQHEKKDMKPIEIIVRIADRLASEERRAEPGIPQSDPAEAPLIPTAARVEFREEKPKDWMHWGFNLSALRLDHECVFPESNIGVSSKDYSRLWDEFEVELKSLVQIKDYFGLISLLALLRKYTTFIASATPWEKDEEHRTLPDISLYDHLKVSSAIAVCLRRYPDHLEALYHQRNPVTEREPVARLLRADFSGIQDFIYRITRAEPSGEFRNTAKRLRGRSFYLALLADITADWMARELEVSPANILFCGGGRFDLLIGIDPKTEEKLQKSLIPELQEWLIEEHYGELGIQIAIENLYPDDFRDLRRAFKALEEELANKKRQKFKEMVVSDKKFFVDKELHHVCNFCNVTPLPEETQCDSCALQAEIGGKLPRTDYMAYLYKNGKDFPLPKGAVTIDFLDQFGLTVALLGKEDIKEMVNQAAKRMEPAVIYRLNDTDFLHDGESANVNFGFKFIGNAAPIGKELLSPNPVNKDKEAIKPDEVLDFEEVAFMSTGAKLLGVLKADVDYLGQVFGLGVEPPTIARISTLSNSFDLFFAGWINKICEQLADKWHSDSENENPLKGKVDGLFYIVYSGGDDLLILGPWDAVIDLAQEIYHQFRDFTCNNENITISGGILLVKPHFPIQRFARLAGEQLEKSKKPDRNQHNSFNRKDRITLFGESVPWRGNGTSFKGLLEFAEALTAKVLDKKLPRSFIYFLMRLHKQHFAKEGEQKLMWIPKFHYALARRVSKEVMADTKLNLTPNVPLMMEHIRIPLSYVSLKIRRD